jgi:hypothetical protein
MSKEKEHRDMAPAVSAEQLQQMRDAVTALGAKVKEAKAVGGWGVWGGGVCVWGGGGCVSLEEGRGAAAVARAAAAAAWKTCCRQ